MRSGTVPTALVVGLGEACRLMIQEREADKAHVERLSTYLFDQVLCLLFSPVSVFVFVCVYRSGNVLLFAELVARCLKAYGDAGV